MSKANGHAKQAPTANPQASGFNKWLTRLGIFAVLVLVCGFLDTIKVSDTSY
jgi:hypothetical protein